MEHFRVFGHWISPAARICSGGDFPAPRRALALLSTEMGDGAKGVPAAGRARGLIPAMSEHCRGDSKEGRAPRDQGACCEWTRGEWEQGQAYVGRDPSVAFAKSSGRQEGSESRGTSRP